MSWIECKHRMPTAEDGNKHGDVFWLRDAEHAFSGIWNARACDLVAWMPIPDFVPLPEPPEGYRIIDTATEPFSSEAMWYSAHVGLWQRSLNASNYGPGVFYAVPITLPDPPAGYRILTDRSMPWHPHTKHWVSRISEWQASGIHHKREYIGDDIYAVPIDPPEPPEPPEGYRLVTDHDETPHREAIYWLTAAGGPWSQRNPLMVGKEYTGPYFYAAPIDPPKPPEGFRIVDTATEPFDAMAHYYSVKLDRWVRTLARGYYAGNLTYAVPIAPPNPQYRPFANADEFRPYQHLWWKVRGESRHCPPRAYDDAGTLNTWQYMFEHCEFQDGEPFGVRIGGGE